MTALEQLSNEVRELLLTYGFDEGQFKALQERIATGDLTQASNIVQGEVSAPPEDEWEDLPSHNTAEGAEASSVGEEALANGEVGAIILNGGMATRFGGVVKGIVEALPRRSFLSLKLDDLVNASSGKCPVWLMNSFATDTPTQQHLEEQKHFGHDPDTIHHYTQGISLRMNLDGGVHLDAGGEASCHGPGHGDCTVFFRKSGCLERFLSGGGKYLFISNVDNLAARLDPIVIGTHILSGKDMTAEVAPKWPGDQGGAPACVDDELWVVEGFRFPEAFDQDLIPVFNTNTFTVTAAALDQDFPLTPCYVQKNLDDKNVVQIETLVGELTRFLSTKYLRVSRTGHRSRFFPIKTPEDLADGLEDLELICG